MKHLFIILTIICAVSLATIIIIWPEQEPVNDDTVVTINGHALSREAILEYKSKDPHHGQDEDFINEIITKQLLIAEAQRLSIDKEPAFRIALKTFYEHSLIKILMERIQQDSNIEVSAEEIDNYLSSFGKTFTFFTLKASGDVTTETVKAKGTRYVSVFDDLSSSLQQKLVSLSPGETISTFVTGNEKIALHLEKIEGETNLKQNFDKEILKEQLLNTKIEEYTTRMINDLRDQASITFHNMQDK